MNENNVNSPNNTSPSQPTIKVVSWNVNGLRALQASNQFEPFMSRYSDADIVCLQETKLRCPEDIGADLALIPDYESYWASHGVKRGYCGVVTYAKTGITKHVQYDFGDPFRFCEGRLVVSDHDQFVLFNVYFPNGQQGESRIEYKFHFFQRLATLVRAIRLGRRFEELSIEDQHTLVLMYHQSQSITSSPSTPVALSSFPIAQFLNTLVSSPPNESGTQSSTRRREILVVGDLNVSLFDLDTHDAKTSTYFSGHLPEERLHVATLVHLPCGLLPDLRLSVRRNQKAWRIPKPGLESGDGNIENKDKQYQKSVDLLEASLVNSNNNDDSHITISELKGEKELVIAKESKAITNNDPSGEHDVGDGIDNGNGSTNEQDDNGKNKQEREQEREQEQEQDGYLSDSDRPSLPIQNRMISYDVPIQPLLYDVFRLRYPLRPRAYTNWNTLKGLRQINVGARIDVTLATPGLIVTDEKKDLSSGRKEEIEVLYPQTTADAKSSRFGVDDTTFADIDPTVYGSDHCPVWIQFRLRSQFMSEKKTWKNEPLRIGPFVAPKQCVKYDPKFKGKQKSLMSFFGNITAQPGETGSPRPLPSSQLADTPAKLAFSPLQTIATDPFSSLSTTSSTSRGFFSKIPKEGIVGNTTDTIKSHHGDPIVEKNTVENEEDEIQVSEVYQSPLVSTPSTSLSPQPPLSSLARRSSTTTTASAFVSFGDDYFGASPSLPKKPKFGFFSKKK